MFLIVALIDRKAGHLDWNTLVLGSTLWFARTLRTARRLVLQSSLSKVGRVRRSAWQGKERQLNARLVSALHPLLGDWAFALR